MAVLASLLSLTACQERPSPFDYPGMFLVEKGPYQALYGPDGKIVRLLYDANGDRKADVVTLYGPLGRPVSAEIDTDFDGVVDQWEHYGLRGNLEKVGHSRNKPGVPDQWDCLSLGGALSRKEYDDDGDGKVDRTEYFVGGQVVLEELDTDHDGKPDRRLVRGAKGEVLKIDVDRDQDGIWETSLRVQH